MLLLNSTSDVIRVITSGTADIDIHASYVDLSGSTVTPGRTNSAVASATTTTAVPAPGASTARTVKTLTVRNKHASTANTITISHYDGTTAVELLKLSLTAGWAIHYDEGDGFEIFDSTGRKVTNNSQNGSGAAVNSLNIVVLSSDVTNNNASANSIADVTGLSFSVTAGETYLFRFVCDYTANNTTTGSRWSVNGPSATRLSYRSSYSLTTTSETVNSGLTAYDLPAASNTTSASTAGNQAVVEGYITPSANGTVILRFASEVSSAAIIAKAGSKLLWVRTV
jgi:hypothetical protein